MIRPVSAKPLSGYRLEVAFNDGVTGVFSVEPQRRGGVFLKLLEHRVFAAVAVNPDFGCVEWPGGVDLCPTTMHDEIYGQSAQQSGRCPLKREIQAGNEESVYSIS